MKKIFVISGLILTCILGTVVVDMQSASAEYSRCKSNRSAYCFRRGDSGRLVYSLIERLRCAGYYNVGNDSWFGPVTDRAVRRLQRDNGLTPDGVVGPQTFRLINQVCSARNSSTTQVSSTSISGTSLRKGRYYQRGSKYIEVHKLGNRYCYLGGSYHGSTIASINKVSRNPDVYEVFNPKRAKRATLRQESRSVLIFWSSRYDFDEAVGSPSGDVLACLKSNGTYYKFYK